jgi:hypothetical protein
MRFCRDLADLFVQLHVQEEGMSVANSGDWVGVDCARGDIFAGTLLAEQVIWCRVPELRYGMTCQRS